MALAFRMRCCRLCSKRHNRFDGRVHIGIANVRQRLELLYAGKAEVHLENRPDGGTHVSVILPLNYGTEQPEKEETL